MINRDPQPLLHLPLLARSRDLKYASCEPHLPSITPHRDSLVWVCFGSGLPFPGGEEGGVEFLLQLDVSIFRIVLMGLRGDDGV
jgi:hypothetical protein